MNSSLSLSLYSFAGLNTYKTPIRINDFNQRLVDLPEHRVCQVETALTGDQEWMVLQGFLAEMDLRARMVTRAHPDPRDHRALMVFLAIEEKWALKERKAHLENKVISNYFLSIFLLPLQNLRAMSWSILS